MLDEGVRGLLVECSCALIFLFLSSGQNGSSAVNTRVYILHTQHSRGSHYAKPPHFGISGKIRASRVFVKQQRALETDYDINETGNLVSICSILCS